MKQQIGIIGYGNMGRFMAQHLRKYAKLKIYDPNVDPTQSSEVATLEQAASQPIVILAIPIQHLKSVLVQAGRYIMPTALVIDICSVKMIPALLMQKYLPQKTHFLPTHPVFGPQSGKRSIAGLTLAVCPGRISRAREKKVLDFCRKSLKLKVVKISPQQHDTEMAYALSLTHLIAKAFINIDIPRLKLPTLSYSLLLQIKENLGPDSEELFTTIQQYNPSAKVVRQNFISELTDQENEIETKLQASEHTYLDSTENTI